MGLDSSLYKEKTFYGIGEHYKVTVKGTLDKNLKTNVDKKPTNYSEDNLEFLSITTEIAYWRKANQIHKWFVDTLGGGKDECQKIPVTIDDLKNLLEICKKVKKSCKLVDSGESYKYYDLTESKEKEDKFLIIEDSSVAQELLPTQSGFFFGSTNYDMWYLEDIDKTIRQLEKIIKESEADGLLVDYYYRASW